LGLNLLIIGEEGNGIMEEKTWPSPLGHQIKPNLFPKIILPTGKEMGFNGWESL